jgi:hypothetical protein
LGATSIVPVLSLGKTLETGNAQRSLNLRTPRQTGRNATSGVYLRQKMRKIFAFA